MNSVDSLLCWTSILFSVRFIFSSAVCAMLRSKNRAFVLPFVMMVCGYFYWIGGLLGFTGVVPSIAALALTLFICTTFLHVSRCEKTFESDPMEELAFWGIFFLGVLIRSKIPDWTGSEKFPDLGYFQACALDAKYPPMDRWLPPLAINYYYMSYVLFVPLFKVSMIPVEIFVNLVVPTILAMLGSVTYGFVKEKTGSTKVAMLSTLYAAIFGNWEWIKQTYLSVALSVFSWWNSSRAIPFAITEFPFFSFLLGDFHPHFNSLPWFALSAWIILELRTVAMVPLVALAIGIHYPMNAWELPVLALMCAVVHRRHWLRLSCIAVLSLALFLPFWLDYEKPVSGIYWVTYAQRSKGLDFLYHWMPFLVPVLFTQLSEFTMKNAWEPVLVLPTFLLGQAVGCLCLCFYFFRKLLFGQRTLEGSLLLFSMLLMLFCEFFSLDPTYGSDYFRMNTVFKFYMLAWWMLSAAIPIILYKAKINRYVLAIFCMCGMVYPVRATLARWDEVHVKTPTLDGLSYWEERFPLEKEAVEWLRRHTGEHDVLLEAHGPPYSEFGRFSTFTGRPSVLGWTNHEQVWRKIGYSLAIDRENDLSFFLKKAEPFVLRNVLETYHVRWVVVGKLERESYDATVLTWLAGYPLVFGNAGVSVYSVPQPTDSK